MIPPGPSPSLLPNAVLLLGGKSRRMGRDKAALSWQGQPLWRWQWEKLGAPGFHRRWLSLRREQHISGLPPEAELLHDEPGAAGVVEVLQNALTREARPLVLLAVDLPLLPVAWIERLTNFSRQNQGQRGLAAFTRQGWEPLAALWPPQAGQVLREEGPVSLQKLLEIGEQAGWMERHRVDAGEEKWFHNMNTLQEYEQLSRETAQNPAVVETRRQQWRDGGWRRDEPDLLACEEPLEIRVEGQSIAVVMRTPGHDEELAAGFLVSEGVVRQKSDLFEVSTCPSLSGRGGVADVLLRQGSRVDLKALTRHVFSSSSCGICGKAVLDEIFLDLPPLEASWEVTPEWLLSLPDLLRAAQVAFASTGGLHASAILARNGGLVQVREDVGRHNALDKLLGWALREDRLPLAEHVLLVSGRVSFELMQKSLAAGIPLVAAISAPSSMAVDFARRSGQTLVGFLRGGSLNVYANAGRVKNACQLDDSRL